MFLDRAWTKLRQRRKQAGFHSPFGGLWTDRHDALLRLEHKLARGELSPEDGERLRGWILRGFAVLPGALPADTIERLNRDVEELWRSRDRRAWVELGGQVLRLDDELRAEHCKLVDIYAHSRAALELALAEPIRRFLVQVFELEPVLFQSLSFERGSEQPIHQDTAYVVVTPPLAFVATWIALEDVRPGSGELAYHPGSHRMEEFLFGGGYRNWNRERDGLELQQRYHDWLLERLDARGLARERFLPRKGDVLFWSADLAHGGTPIVDRTLTRRSLVSHYCPSNARPYYFSYRSDRRVRKRLGDATFASAHYDLARPVLPGFE